MQEATLAQLAKTRREDTPYGITALELAEAIDAGAESGAALASMVREHAAALERAERGGDAHDPVAERESTVAERALRVVGRRDGAG